MLKTFYQLFTFCSLDNFTQAIFHIVFRFPALITYSIKLISSYSSIVVCFSQTFLSTNPLKQSSILSFSIFFPFPLLKCLPVRYIFTQFFFLHFHTHTHNSTHHSFSNFCCHLLYKFILLFSTEYFLIEHEYHYTHCMERHDFH